MKTYAQNALQVLALSLAATLPAASPARADIQTTSEMRTGGQLLSTTVTSKAAGAERVEMTMKIGPMTQKSTTLTLCAKKEMYTLDEALRIYTVTRLVAAPQPGEKPAGGKSSGTITTTLVSLKELGEETIGGTKTRCFEVTMRNQTTGCPGESDTTSTQQFCVAVDGDAGGGGAGCNLVAAGTGERGDNCQPTVVRKGDWARYDKLMESLTVRTRFSGGGAGQQDDGAQGVGVVETLVKKVSRDKLPSSLFALPEGFRKVSAQEFQQAQVQAMMRGMANSAGAQGAE